MQAKVVDLMRSRRRPLAWVALGDGSHLLSLSTQRLRLYPVSEGYAVERVLKGEFPEEIWRGHSLEYGQGVVEDIVRSNKFDATIADPTAPWRAAPASEKQRLLLAKRGLIAPGQPLSKGQASDMINRLFAGQRG